MNIKKGKRERERGVVLRFKNFQELQGAKSYEGLKRVREREREL